ncbi:MAG: YfhO family protein [Ruminococcus sp.]|nr:YfhO family protein [Ruminococcus sp.]
MNFIKRNRAHFIAPAVVMLILMVIFAVKHVYPFGDVNVGYYDMTVQYIPLYTHTHDFLHGNAPMLFDWYNGAGSDFTVNDIVYGFSPMNLFFLFVSRDGILNAMTFFLLIKLMLCSFTMSLYLKKVRSADDITNIALSVFYAFCGYNLQYYMNIFFLDIVILFPLLMLSLDRLLRSGKPLCYTAAAAAMIMVNFYLSVMAFVFLIFYCFGHMLFIQTDPKERRRISAQLGLFTVLALVISAFIVLPPLLKLTVSPRADYINQSFVDMLTSRKGDYDPHKQFMLLGTELGIAALIFSIFLAKKNKKPVPKETWLGIYLMGILLIPVISEGSNILWHMGSYAHFPYRFGYIFAFVSADIFAGFCSGLKDDIPAAKPASAKAEKAIRYGSVFTRAGAVIILIVMCLLIKNAGITDLDTYSIYIFALAAAVISTVLAMAVFSRKQLGIYASAAVLLQSLICGYGLLAPGTGDAFNNVGGDLRNSLDIEHDNLSRIHQLHNCLFPNYGILTGTPSLGDWTLGISREYFDETANLGYTTDYTIAYDVGGTGFSDALLNVKKIFQYVETDSRLYTYSQEMKGYRFYDCNYTLPFGILTGKDFTEVSYGKNDTPFTYQNRLYKALSGDDDDLFTVYRFKDHITAEDSEMVTNVMFPFTYTAEFEITEPSVLYLYEKDSINVLMQININGKPACIPYGSELKNNTFPRADENGTVYIGDSDSGKVTISVISSTEASESFYIGALSTEKLGRLCDIYKDGSHAENVKAEGYKLTMNVPDPQGRYVFIPVEYNSNWRAEVNGKKTDVISVMNGAFMAVKLGSEDADITLKFVPVTHFISLVISIVGLVMLVLILLLIRKGHDPAKAKTFGTAAYICFSAAAAGLLLLLCIAPTIGYIVSFFI